jgi:hypothetical protein
MAAGNKFTDKGRELLSAFFSLPAMRSGEIIVFLVVVVPRK